MSDIIDQKTITELKELMGPAFSALVERYLAQSLQYLQTINDGMAEGDAAKVAQAAHPLKSSSRQLGAEHLHNLAKTLEEDAKENGAITDAMRSAHAELEASFSSVTDALNEELKKS